MHIQILFLVRLLQCCTFQRTITVERYADKLIEAMHAGDEYEVYVTDSALFAPWLLLLIIGTFIIYGGLMVVSGDLSLASFLSTISMFQSLGAEFESLFQDSIFITSSYASIAQLTVFLNLPVDVPDRQKLSKVHP